MHSVKRKRVLYLPSTPLNLLIAVAHSIAYRENQVAQLVLIDQKTLIKNPYLSALNHWQESCFEQVYLTAGSAKGLGKLIERKAVFLKLKSIADSFRPDVIAVGNDRRVEFQSLMHYCNQNLDQVSGWYMDDGLYSYAGRPHSFFKDSINGLLKKIVYGFWWQEPETVGASNWIDQVWLFSPDLAVMPLHKKQAKLIQPAWFEQLEVISFSEQVLLQFGLNHEVKDRVRKADLFLLLPHPSDIKKMAGYGERIKEFLRTLNNLRLKTVVKYHPRSQGEDALGLKKECELLVLPSGLAFEFILPLMLSRAIVLGDISTVLITTKWLRPDLRSLAVLVESDSYAQQFKTIIESLEIPVLNSFDEVFFKINSTNT